MGILNKAINGIYDLRRAIKGEPQVWHTAFGDLQLAGRGDRRKAESILAKLQRTTEALTKGDILKWRRAWQLAIDADSPNRQWLYDIYRDADIDAHLSGCIGQRMGFVLARSFNVEDKEGTPHNELRHFLEQEWFDDFCRLVLTTPYWGHTLIELGDLTTDGDGCLAYDGVRLIDRRYVIPERHCFVTDLGQDWTTGIDYHTPEYMGNLVEVGKPDDLGLYLKAAQHTIPKKNVLAAWDVFGEIFGIPLRVATTSSRSQGETDKIEEMMRRMGLASYAVLPEGTSVQLVENAKSDAYNVYDKRIDRANSELSKLIIGQTMTIEDGSSLSQSQTHLEVFQNIVEGDAKLLANTINNQLIPHMVQHGFPLQGMSFKWDESIDYTPEQQMAYEQMVADRYEVDGKYFADKYNMPVGERIQQPSLFGSDEVTGGSDEVSSESDEVPDESDEQEEKLARRFLNKNGSTSVVSCEHDDTRFARFFD